MIKSIVFCGAFKIYVTNFLEKMWSLRSLRLPPPNFSFFVYLAVYFLQETIYTKKCGNAVVPNPCNVAGFVSSLVIIY